MRDAGLEGCWPLVIDHLRVSDIFRLSRALCLREWPPDVVGLVRHRLRVRTGRSLPEVTAEMRGRCRECGRAYRCRVALAVCPRCAADPMSFYHLMSRRDISARWRHTFPSQRRLDAFVRTLPVSKRSARTGAYLYLARAVQQARAALTE